MNPSPFGIEYVVKLSNGKYYAGLYSSNGETDTVEFASKYVFDWQIIGDMYLQSHINRNNLTYKALKVKVRYEVIEEE